MPFRAVLPMKVSPHHHHHHHHLGLRPHCVWTRGHCVVRGRQSQRQPGGGLPLPSLLLRACKCLQAPAAPPSSCVGTHPQQCQSVLVRCAHTDTASPQSQPVECHSCLQWHKTHVCVRVCEKNVVGGLTTVDTGTCLQSTAHILVDRAEHHRPSRGARG